MKFELTKKFLQEIIDKIDRQEFELIKTELSELHNVDIAELIEELDRSMAKSYLNFLKMKLQQKSLSS